MDDRQLTEWDDLAPWQPAPWWLSGTCVAIGCGVLVAVFLACAFAARGMGR